MTDEINEKLEELSNLCQKHDLPIISVIFNEEADVNTTLIVGGKNQDMSLMVAEIIASIVEDIKSTNDHQEKKIQSRDLLDMFLGDISEHLEQYLINSDVEQPEINHALATLSDKIEKEIDVKLKSILVGSTLTKELIGEAKKATNEILTNYSLENKVTFDIKIKPDGMAEVSFRSKKKDGALH